MISANSLTVGGVLHKLIHMIAKNCFQLISFIVLSAIAETLPEYKILRNMPGVGERLGPLILAEIGNVRRFHSGKALNAYAGNDAPPYQSGNFESHNRHISKRGNAALRKYCFEVMQALKLIKPKDDPVYLFLLKKEQKGNISTLPRWLPLISFYEFTMSE